MNFFLFNKHPIKSSIHRKSKRGFLAILIFIIAAGVAAAELPDSAILIVLGHDSKTLPLQRFADQVERQVQRRAVTYRDFESARYTSEKGKWWDRLPFDRVTGTVEQAIRLAVSRYPHTKVIAFNLDGYDPRELFDKDGKEVVSYTNFEVRLPLCEQKSLLSHALVS